MSDDGDRGAPGKGLINGLAVTLKTMTKRSTTQQYPDVEPGPAAPLPRRDRPARGELHGLHAVRPRVPGLVHLHRLAQGGGRRPGRRPAPAAQRARPVRHRLLAVHVLRHLHRGLPVRRAATGRPSSSTPSTTSATCCTTRTGWATGCRPSRRRRRTTCSASRPRRRPRRRARPPARARPLPPRPQAGYARPTADRAPTARRGRRDAARADGATPGRRRASRRDRRRRAAARPGRRRGRLRRARGDQQPPGPGRPLPGGQPGRGRRPLPGARRRAGGLGAGAGLRRRGGRPAAVRGDADPRPDRAVRRPGPAGAGRPLLVGGGVGLGLAALLADAFRWTTVHAAAQPGTAERMGEQIFGDWVLPFEVLSILLLAALVGAIVLSRPDIGARASRGRRTAGRRPIADARRSSRTSSPRCSSGSASTACCAGATRSWC